jgi:hypothetical protein
MCHVFIVRVMSGVCSCVSKHRERCSMKWDIGRPTVVVGRVNMVISCESVILHISRWMVGVSMSLLNKAC